MEKIRDLLDSKYICPVKFCGMTQKCFSVTKGNLPIGESKNRVPYVKVLDIS